MSVTFPPGAVLILFASCTACGLKGPLYLPDRATNVEVRPAPAAGTPAPAATDEVSDDEKRRESDQADPTQQTGG